MVGPDQLRAVTEAGMLGLLVYVVVVQLPRLGGRVEALVRWGVQLHFDALTAERDDCNARIRHLTDTLIGLTARVADRALPPSP